MLRTAMQQLMNAIRYKEVFSLGLFLVFGFTACAWFSEDQFQAALAAPASDTLDQSSQPRTAEGKYKLIPLEELRSQYYRPGLLQKLLKGGV